MAIKQEHHLEYHCGKSKYSRTDLTTLVLSLSLSRLFFFFLFTPQRSSYADILKRYNSAKSFPGTVGDPLFQTRAVLLSTAPQKNWRCSQHNIKICDEIYKCSFDLRRESLHNLLYLYLRREQLHYSWVIGFPFFTEHSLSVFLSGVCSSHFIVNVLRYWEYICLNAQKTFILIHRKLEALHTHVHVVYQTKNL